MTEAPRGARRRRPSACAVRRARPGSRCRRPFRSRRCGSSRGSRRFARVIRTSRSTCPRTIALVDLARGDVDVAVRYLPDAAAPEHAVRLFGERMTPVASPDGRARRIAAALAGRPHAARAAASRRPRRPHAVARLAQLARVQRAAGAEARGLAALSDLRPGRAGRGRRPGRGARPVADDRRAFARRPAGGAVCAQVRFGARLLRAGGAARRRARRRRGVPALARRRSGARSGARRSHRAAGAALLATPPARRAARCRRSAEATRPRMQPHATPDHDLRPSAWIERFAHLVPAGARVLDLAAGRGRHARLFAARGAHVVAVDRDADALASLAASPASRRCVADLEARPWPFRGRDVRRDRRRRTTCIGRCSRASARRAGRRRRAALRDVRERQRSARPPVEPRLPAARKTNCSTSRAGG